MSKSLSDIFSMTLKGLIYGTSMELLFDLTYENMRTFI